MEREIPCLSLFVASRGLVPEFRTLILELPVVKFKVNEAIDEEERPVISCKAV
jgi:hypothetical protein